MFKQVSSVLCLLTIIALVGYRLSVPVFATFCQVSHIAYNYPRQVSPSESFSTTVVISGVCAPDDADYYSIRSDLNDALGFVTSDVSVPIGFSQGQNWTVTLENQATAPAGSASWQISFAVYVFAATGSGTILDSVTFNQVTIEVGTLQPAQATAIDQLQFGMNFLTAQSHQLAWDQVREPLKVPC